MIRRPPVREQIGQVMENVVGPKPPGHQDCQALLERLRDLQMPDRVIRPH